jgi:hypothetical protein
MPSLIGSIDGKRHFNCHKQILHKGGEIVFKSICLFRGTDRINGKEVNTQFNFTDNL